MLTRATCELDEGRPEHFQGLTFFAFPSKGLEQITYLFIMTNKVVSATMLRGKRIH